MCLFSHLYEVKINQLGDLICVITCLLLLCDNEIHDQVNVVKCLLEIDMYRLLVLWPVEVLHNYHIPRSRAVHKSKGSHLNQKGPPLDLRDSGCWRMRTMSV